MSLTDRITRSSKPRNYYKRDNIRCEWEKAV